MAISNTSPGAKISRNTLTDNMVTKTKYAAVNLSSGAHGAQIVDNTIVGTAAQRAILAPAGTVQERNVIAGMAA